MGPERISREAPDAPRVDVEIRRATEKDLSALARLLRQVADEEVHVATPPGVSPATAESVWRASLARAEAGGSAELVATVKGRVVGSGSIERGGARQSHVGDLYLFLARDWRGKGIGGTLLDALEREARAMELEKISVTVFAGNAPARQLFESRGYVVEGIRRRNREVGGIREDELLMAKFL